MARTKGAPKTGGRKKGTENKISRELRKTFEDVINDKLPELVKKESWSQLDDADKWNVLLKMSAFVIPKKHENSVGFDKLKNTAESLQKINELFA